MVHFFSACNPWLAARCLALRQSNRTTWSSRSLMHLERRNTSAEEISVLFRRANSPLQIQGRRCRKCLPVIPPSHFPRVVIVVSIFLAKRLNTARTAPDGLASPAVAFLPNFPHIDAMIGYTKVSDLRNQKVGRTPLPTSPSKFSCLEDVRGILQGWTKSIATFVVLIARSLYPALDLRLMVFCSSIGHS